MSRRRDASLIIENGTVVELDGTEKVVTFADGSTVVDGVDVTPTAVHHVKPIPAVSPLGEGAVMHVAPNSPPQGGASTPQVVSASFEVVAYPAVTLLTTRATCSHNQIPEVTGQLFRKILMSAGDVVPAGRPRVYYVSWLSDACTIDVALPFASVINPGGDILIQEIPAGTALRTTYFGLRSGLLDVWPNMWSEVEQLGLRPTGLAWEEFVTDDNLQPHPLKWQTDCYAQVHAPSGA
jgi:effector-binding domain-containing protein